MLAHTDVIMDVDFTNENILSKVRAIIIPLQKLFCV